MEDTSSSVASKDNAATIPSLLNGITSLTREDTDDLKQPSMNISSSSVSSNGTITISSNSRTQQQQQQSQKQTNGVIQGQRRLTIDQFNMLRQKKVAAGVELKGKIIEFMRDKPYLWNRWHPSYSDNKRRESEFGLFSEEIGHPVAEIKRVWHVLRTNFFRAHKYQTGKYPNGNGNKGERCWKYYQSMRYILDSMQSNNNSNISSNNGNHTDGSQSINHSNNNVSINDDSSSSVQEIRRTRSAKVQKLASSSKRKTIQRISQQSSNITSDSSSNSTNVPPTLILEQSNSTAIIASTSTPTKTADYNATFSRGTRGHKSRSRKVERADGHDTSIITDRSPEHLRGLALSHGHTSNLTAFNGTSRISFDADDDHLYARSLTATLKKFDPTTKEVIKLKFQEIIVEYMQKQQQQQLQSYQHHQQQQQQQQQQPPLICVVSRPATAAATTTTTTTTTMTPAVTTVMTDATTTQPRLSPG